MKGRVSLNQITMIFIILFPLATLVSDLPVLGLVTKTMGLGLIGLFLIGMVLEPLSRYQFFVFLLLIALTVAMPVWDISGGKLSSADFSGNSNINLYTYFPVWCLYFLYMQRNFEKFIFFLYNNLSLLNKLCFAWSVVMLVSLAYPGAYAVRWGAGTYFSSFAGGEHRFASSCAFELPLAWVLARQTGRRRYYWYVAFPTLGIFLCGARTYLGVLALALLGIYYILLRNKKVFYASILPLLALFVALVFVSPMGSKMAVTFRGEGYGGFWYVVTNSRSAIWASNIDTYINSDLMRQLIGGGALYVHITNAEKGLAKVWAHNDFIQILLANGILGLWCYLTTIFGFALTRLKAIRKETPVPRFLSACFFIIWIFNAFFNGVYVYTCAMLSLPVYFNALFYPGKKENMISDEGERNDSNRAEIYRRI